MQKLINGIHRFHDTVFRPRFEFFNRLVDGQRPQALFITCSDSRMVPDLICQTDPGDLFVIRNAGNIVPPFTTGSATGEAATIEFAVRGLDIRDVIVCGHTHCGAMRAVLHPEDAAGMARVRDWLGNAAAAGEIVSTCYRHLTGDARWGVMVQENVLVQIENLRTHPVVAAGLAAGELRLHAWVYKMETGQVFAYDSGSGQYAALSREQAAVPLARGPVAARQLLVAPPAEVRA
jgi:carbonic anhydrase